MKTRTTYGGWNECMVDNYGESTHGMVICRWTRHGGEQERYMIEWRHPTGHGAYDWYQGRSDMGLSAETLNKVLDKVEDTVRRMPVNANPTMIRGMVSRMVESIREEII